MKILRSNVSLRTRCAACLLGIFIVIAGCASISYSPEDTALQRRVQSAIRTSSAGSSSSIHVVVQQGAVVLHGSVNRGVDKVLIGKAANSVDGVVSVKNYITVQ